MTLTELRDKADAKLVTFWQLLVPKQLAYHAKHGRFFQLLPSPQDVVIDGVDSTFEVLPPPHEAFVVDFDLGDWQEKIPFQLRVDERCSNTWQSFIATVYVQLTNGDVYTRRREYILDDGDNVQQVDSGWSKYEVPPVIPDIT